MSYVLLMTADKPLPLCDQSAVRETVSGKYSVSFACGFTVEEHKYYRKATDELDYPFKPFQYELDLYNDEADLHHLKDYFTENFKPGETVDLWPVRVSDVEGKTCPSCRKGTLAEFNMDTMGILTEVKEYGEECWLSITI